MPTALARQAPEQVLYKIPEVMAMLRMSRHVVYEQIRAGRLRIVKQGRATFVTASAIRSYVELLEREAEEGETSTAVITKVMASRAGPRVACRRSPPWWCRVCDKRSQARRPRIADLTASAQRAHAARPTEEWGVSPGRFTITGEAGARTLCGYGEECRITGGQGPPSAMTEGEFR